MIATVIDILGNYAYFQLDGVGTVALPIYQCPNIEVGDLLELTLTPKFHILDARIIQSKDEMVYKYNPKEGF